MLIPPQVHKLTPVLGGWKNAIILKLKEGCYESKAVNILAGNHASKCDKNT
jgi:hypothetical protein